MPVIEIKTNTKISVAQKKTISEGFVRSFAEAGETEVAKNVLIEIQDERWIDFRGDAEEPAALVTIHPGPLTPEKDYAMIVAGFFATLQRVLPEIPQQRIYMTISEIRHWGWNGRKL
ncbi:MAG: hypothetical protein K6A77_10300 [Clostridiales bacterium]|nr:hypothetical protein [Clostridiales bacterium]